MFRQKYEEIMGQTPRPEIEEYILTIGIKLDSTRDTVFENFSVLFQDKTDQIVEFLFSQVAPRITMLAQELLKQKDSFVDESSMQKIANAQANDNRNAAEEGEIVV